MWYLTHSPYRGRNSDTTTSGSSGKMFFIRSMTSAITASEAEANKTLTTSNQFA